MLGLKMRLCSLKAVFSSNCQTSTTLHAPHSSESYKFQFSNSMSRDASGCHLRAVTIKFSCTSKLQEYYNSLALGKHKLSIKLKRTFGGRSEYKPTFLWPFSSKETILKKPYTRGEEGENDGTCRVNIVF